MLLLSSYKDKSSTVFQQIISYIFQTGQPKHFCWSKANEVSLKCRCDYEGTICFCLFFLRKRWWALNWFFCLLIFFVIFDHLFIFFYLLCGRCCCYCSWGMWSFLFHMCELVRTELILVSDASLLMAEFRLLKRWKQQLDGTSRS